MKKTFIYSVIFSLISAPAVADDIELFTGDSSSAASNVVFLFDTSGSMGYAGEYVSEEYDPDTVYDNDLYGFESDKYYMYRLPIFEDFDSFLADDHDNIRQNVISESQIACSDILDSVSTTGEAGGAFAYWRNGQGWYAPLLSSSSNNVTFNDGDSSALVECKDGGSEGYEYGGTSYRNLSSSSSFPYTQNRLLGTWSWGLKAYDRVWSGNYLNYYAIYGSDAAYEVSRMEVLRRAAKEVIQSLPANVNIALMRFDHTSSYKGGYVVVEMKPGKDNYEEFAAALDAFVPTGGTPITEALHESYLYTSEQNMEYGVGKSTPDSYTGNQYHIPELSACSITTKVVLFSDGKPEADTDSNEYVSKLVGGLVTDPLGTLVFDCNSLTSGLLKTDGICAEEMAYHMYSEEGVIVDTIGGFSTEDPAFTEKLEGIADAGGGTFYAADDYQQIKDALLDSTVKTLVTPATYTSPAIAVSSYNSLELSDELYYAVFEPTPDYAWKGNLKRYAITNDGIVDKEGNLAVDPNTGFFKDSAKSYWLVGDDPDGSTVSKGGAANKQDPDTRNIYTIRNGSLRAFDHQSASYIQDETLGLDLVADSDTVDADTGLSYRDQLLYWIDGRSTTGAARLGLEDPLHSRPVVVNYDEGDQVVFLGTNSGYIHALNTSDGTERFAILPEETLKNPNYYLSPEYIPNESKIYGMDGPITYWHNDHNLNGKVDGSDTVYLYVGMRRGGHSYYALDVTDPDAPSVLWQKHGTYTDTETKNAPSESTGFSRLGQTWSSLRPALVKWDGADRVVLFAGGGYDPDEDGTDSTGPTTRIIHDTGNTVYMLDALTGEVIWDALSALSPADMTSSFPADVAPIDRNNNGYVDLLYAADVGGRVWRFDISEAATTSSDFATGGAIFDANTSASDGIIGNRRFYNRPDISYITETDVPYVLISIGTGYRAHPLSEDIYDYQLLIKDPYGLSVPDSYDSLTLDDLESWASDSDQNALYGWYLGAGTMGEKVLASSITLSGIVTFNSYIPAESIDYTTQCSALGQSNIYQLALTDSALAQADCQEGDTCPMMPGEEVEPVQTVVGLAPDPTVTMPPPDDDSGQPVSCEDSSLVILSGTSTSNGFMNRCDLFNTDYWKENRQ